MRKNGRGEETLLIVSGPVGKEEDLVGYLAISLRGLYRSNANNYNSAQLAAASIYSHSSIFWFTT